MCVAGHVTIGGSVCMEMLTKSGWTPTNDIEVKLLSFSQFMLDLIFGKSYCQLWCEQWKTSTLSMI